MTVTFGLFRLRDYCDLAGTFLTGVLVDLAVSHLMLAGWELLNDGIFFSSTFGKYCQKRIFHNYRTKVSSVRRELSLHPYLLFLVV